ncbi:MAG: tRNA 2-selenouridine(34) synthase MnmH [Lewinellaceae bacterium]|nr:tRNA 2-selenouridine(34) synthase MnmH [Lewinellaceae bacterium]
MQTHIAPSDFLHACASCVLLDVRSPGEYTQGHIPGAINFPLFSDEERAQVGTAYKQQSKEAAMLLGLRIVGPKMETFVREAQQLAPERRLAVHCWRGGQRSQSMAWLFRQAGFEVVTLDGGYKQYRRYVLTGFENTTVSMIVIGGKTGTGKTKILHALRDQGEQILDLEAIAHHKGSAFGSIGEQPQPTVEQFENNLFDAITHLDTARHVWVENESRSIGRVYIPEVFWKRLRSMPLFNITVPQASRIQNLVADYVGFSAEELEAAFLRIEKKLGGQHLKTALDALCRNDYAAAAEIALNYYDKTYRYGLETSIASEIKMLEFAYGDADRIARACREMVGKR